MHHVLHQKSILVLQYILNVETKNIGDRGFELRVFLDQNTKIYIQVYKQSNFSGKE